MWVLLAIVVVVVGFAQKPTQISSHAERTGYRGAGPTAYWASDIDVRTPGGIRRRVKIVRRSGRLSGLAGICERPTSTWGRGLFLPM